jgi:hypothetical protein
VKIEDADPDEIVEVTQKSKRVTKGDLPLDPHDYDRFQHTFVPTLIWYTASQDNPWVLNDDDQICAM